jgi:serine protease Do
LKVVRNGFNKTINVTLGELPESAQAGDGNAPAAPEETKADALDGVTVADLNPSLRQQLRASENLQGALVTEVREDSNSAEAGLLPNDVIVEINRQPVAGSGDAVRLCKAAKGEEILVKVWRRMGNFAGTRYISVDNTRTVK